MSTSFDDMVQRMKKTPVRGGSGGGNYLSGAGTYEVEILKTFRKMALDKTKLAQGRDVRDQEFLIVEFKVVTSSNPDHPADTTSSWMCKDPTADKSLGAADAKTFAVSALGINPNRIKDDDDKAQTQAALLVLAALGEAEAFNALKQPESLFVGRRLVLETFVITTKAGKPFTKHIWSPLAQAG